MEDGGNLHRKLSRSIIGDVPEGISGKVYTGNFEEIRKISSEILYGTCSKNKQYLKKFKQQSVKDSLEGSPEEIIRSMEDFTLDSFEKRESIGIIFEIICGKLPENHSE